MELRIWFSYQTLLNKCWVFIFKVLPNRGARLRDALCKTPTILQNWTLRVIGEIRKGKKTLTTELDIFSSKLFFDRK